MATGIQRQTWLSWGVVVPAVVLGLALGLRLVGLDIFLTIDEATWRTRSARFEQALEEHNWAATYQSEHPGVLTMWAGTLGQGMANRVQRLQQDGPAWVAGMARRLGQHQAAVPEVTFWARRLVAVVCWLIIYLIYMLLRPLIGRPASLIALVLLAFDPLLLAHSRLHHLDGLMSSLTALSVVLLFAYGARPSRWAYVLLSAVAAGLAVANKSPGILLVPWAVGTLLWWGWRREHSLRAVLWASLVAGVWTLLVILTVVAVWPALWSAPSETMANIVAGALRQGLNPHELSNFFWNDIRPDPGPAFYPLAWLFRTTPWVMLGLALLGVARGQAGRWRWLIWPVLAYVAGYALFVTLADKKFDRYLLPVFPLLDVLAAMGLAMQLERIRKRDVERAQRWARSLAALVVVSQAWLLLPAYPYYTSYYNPLLGGSRQAGRLFLTGWGEGMEQAAAYLNAKPDAESLHVAAQELNEFAPFFHGRATAAGAVPLMEPDYYVLYASHVQRDFAPEVTGRHYGIEQPEFVASGNKVEYAWVYRNAFFRREGEFLLERMGDATTAPLTPVVVNADAALVRDYEGPLDIEVISAYAREDYVLTKLAHVTEDEEALWLMRLPGMNRELDDMVQQTVEDHGRLDAVILLGGLSARRYLLDDVIALPEPEVPLSAYLGDALQLVGYDLADATLRPGEEAEVRLCWRAQQPVNQDLKVFVHLVGPDGHLVAQDDSLPQGGTLPTTAWEPGHPLLDDHTVTVPEQAEAGAYTLHVGLYDVATVQRLPVRSAKASAAMADHVEIEGIQVR